MSSAVCRLPGCDRPAFADARTGITHDFCGRTHAQQALASQGRELPDPHGICHECALPGCNLPVFFERETGRVHEFCGLSHAQEAQARGLHLPSNRPRQGEGGSSDPICSLPGCTAPCFIDQATGFQHDYCGRTHAVTARQRGLVPPAIAGMDPRWVNRVFRGRAGEPDYTLSELTNAHPRYAGVKQQFAAGWQHPSACPTVLRVYQVRNAQDVLARYLACQRALEPHGGANEVRRFHGTGLLCNFGIDPSAGPCHDQQCSVCTICARSFDLNLAGSGPGGTRMQLRYGRGLYTSRTSSKAHDYAAPSERAGVRVMFLCKVLLGRTLETAEEALGEEQIDMHLAARGAGGAYDSVLGLTTARGGALNYEENVVYSAQQALPSYIIVYRVA